MLETKNLRFKYDNNLELNFPDIKTSKENLLILGRSGVGKTTFLHLLSALIKLIQISLLLERFRAQKRGT